MPWAKVSEKWPDFKLGGFREGVDKATDPREVCMMGGGAHRTPSDVRSGR